MKRLILLLVIVIFFNTCKKADKKPDNIKEPEVESLIITEDKIDVSDGKYRIVFDAIFKEDDLILIYYTTKKDETLSSSKYLTKEVKGSTNSQKIEIVFSANEKPYDVRIDFSDIKDQESIKLSNIIFIDKFNKIVIDKDNLNTFFDFNTQYMTFNKSQSLLKGIIFNDGYNPYFVANNEFKQVLNNFNVASLNKKKEPNLIEDLANINFEDDVERVFITGTFKSDDWVILYYTTETTKDFSEGKFVDIKVKGSNEEQTLVFTLPKDEYMAEVKLDISDYKTQEYINVSEILFKINKYELKIDKLTMSEYFLPNNYIDFNYETGDFTCNIIIENSIQKYNPYFISSAKLIQELLML